MASVGAGGEHHVGGVFRPQERGRRGDAWPRAHAGTGGGAHGTHDLAAGSVEESLEADPWPGDDGERAGRHRLAVRRRSPGGERRADDDGRRPFGHYLAQEGHAVVARHLDIDDQHVRPLPAHPVEGDDRVGRRGEHLDSRCSRQRLGDELASQRRVIDDPGGRAAGRGRTRRPPVPSRGRSLRAGTAPRPADPARRRPVEPLARPDRRR
jgi:hypothetical protein